MDENKKEDFISFIVLIVGIIALIIGFSSDCIRCTNCGDDDNRLVIYASGRDENGVEYKSCVGPAGCLGFGINSKCWPTECVYVEKYAENSKISGCVTYYNKAGCISKSEVKSEGEYSDELTCFNISCFGEKYVETVAESERATTSSSCFGIKCGGASDTEFQGLNDIMPRQFSKGCWSKN